jgi:FkbM family methyltransferase
MLEWWLEPWVPRSGRVFVDVGANVGTWTHWLAPHFQRGYAIEPDPDAVAVLRGHLPANVTAHAVGAWHTETTLTFSRYAETVHTSAYFNEEGINTGLRTGSIELPCRPLDALEIAGPVDFLKCDTEGAEVQVLLGAEELIGRDRPWLLIEAHTLENCLTLTRMLAQWNYLFTIVRHPDYEAFSEWWYAHCWFSCQPIERVNVRRAPEAQPKVAEPRGPTHTP